MSEKIEQTVLFPLVRKAGLVTASIVLVVILVGLVFALTFDPSRKGNNVSYNDVKKNLESNVESSESLTFPDNVKKLFFDEEGKINWQLTRLLQSNFESEDTKGRQKFINDLSGIIGKAEKDAPEKVEEYVGSFVELRFQKDDGDALGLGKLIEPVVKSAVRGLVLFGVCLLFMLFIQIVILLLLLSIERNSRKEV